MKTPYADYAKHAMRVYLRRDEAGTPLTTADLKNKMAVMSALSPMSVPDKEILLDIYRTWSLEHPFKEVIAEKATETQLPVNVIWRMCNEFEYRFARIRGLW